MVSIETEYIRFKRLWLRGRYIDAFEVIKPLAYGGLAEAQFQIGLCYLSGRGVHEVNMSHARKWLETAARSGHTMALSMLSTCCNEERFRQIDEEVQQQSYKNTSERLRELEFESSEEIWKSISSRAIFAEKYKRNSNEEAKKDIHNSIQNKREGAKRRLK